MILLRLLRAGKTLVGVGETERAYRMPEGGGLPRFGGKRNPFRVTTHPERAPHAGASEEIQARVEPAVPAAREAAPSKTPEATPGAAAPVKTSVGQWVAGMRNVFKARPQPQPHPVAEANARPAQGELRLESVQVVRNDLSETDMEIVPRKVGARESSGKAFRPAVAAARNESDTAWSRVSARIFGANNVR